MSSLSNSSFDDDHSAGKGEDLGGGVVVVAPSKASSTDSELAARKRRREKKKRLEEERKLERIDAQCCFRFTIINLFLICLVAGILVEYHWNLIIRLMSRGDYKKYY